MQRLLHGLVVAMGAAFAAIPLVILVAASLSLNTEVDRGINVPFRVTLDNHRTILSAPEAGGIWPFALNSTLVSFGTTATVLLCVVPISALYRYRQGSLRSIILCCAGLGLTVPTVLLMFPLANILQTIRLNGSVWGLVLANASATLPFALWLGCRAMADVPKEISIAGVMDGASPIRRAIRLEIPNALRGIALMASFVFVLAWNDVLFSLYLSSPTNRTLAAEASEIILFSQSIPRTATFAAVGLWTLLPAVGFLTCLLLIARLLPRPIHGHVDTTSNR